MANWKHHCGVLGISPEAGTKTIRRAYRAQALRCHPDLHGGSADSKEAFQRLNASYNYLLENFWRERPSASPKPIEEPKPEEARQAPPGSPAPSPPSKKYWREFAGGNIAERRDPVMPDRRRQTHTPRPDGLDRRVSGRDRRAATEPAVREIRIILPRFLGRLYWRLQHDRKFYRKALRASTALLAVLTLRAFVNFLF